MRHLPLGVQLWLCVENGKSQSTVDTMMTLVSDQEMLAAHQALTAENERREAIALAEAEAQVSAAPNGLALASNPEWNGVYKHAATHNGWPHLK